MSEGVAHQQIAVFVVNAGNGYGEERKKSYDTLSEAPPLTNRETEHNHEIDKLEASIDGAMRGHWRDLRTVFNAVGLTPRRS